MIKVLTTRIRTIAMAWWRHQMETFSTLLALCARNSRVTSEVPSQRSGMRSFDVFFDLRLNKRLSKQSWGWWFETLSRSLWRHGNGIGTSCRMWPRSIRKQHPGTGKIPVAIKTARSDHEFHTVKVIFNIKLRLKIFHDSPLICYDEHILAIRLKYHHYFVV